MPARVVTVGPVDLAVAEAGRGGRPLLLLHGFTGAKEDFADWLDPLAEHGWHAVAPDLRGHGASSKPEGTDGYSLAILAGDGTGLADALGWDRFALLGHSMGGYVAQRMALADPSRLLALVLNDTGHGPLRGFDSTQMSVAISIATEKGMDVLADAVAGRKSPLDTDAHERLLRERLGHAAYEDRKFRATSPWLYAAMAPELMSAPDTLDRLAALEPAPPTLVVVGEQDLPFLDQSRRMADAIAGATLAVIPDAGHGPHFENPTAWWDALSSFLDKVG